MENRLCVGRWRTVALILLAFGFLQSCRRGQEGAAAAGRSSLERIKKEGVLRWGADPSGGAPFVYFDPQNPSRIIGFEVDMMDKLAARMGVRHEIFSADWAGLLDNMLARRTDMVVNGIEINEERKKRFLFSDPYYIYEQQLVIRAEDKDKYKSLDDLKGRHISTLNAAEANNVLRRAGFTEDLIHPYEDSLTPYNEVELGRVDACLQESIIAAFYAGKNPKLYLIPQTFSPGVYGIAFRKEDADLRDEVNRILAEMKASGELAEIYKKWGIWTERQAEIGIVDRKPAE